MAAKKSGNGKVAQLRAMREASHKGAVDTDSIKQQLVELRAKKMAELQEEQTQLLAPLHEQVEAQEAIIKEAQGKIAEISRIIGSITGKPAKSGGATGGTRQRRTKEELEHTAAEVVGFIKQSGATGVSGSEIKGKFDSLLPSIKEFLKLYAPDFKLTTKGEKAAMTYHS